MITLHDKLHLVVGLTLNTCAVAFNIYLIAAIMLRFAVVSTIVNKKNYFITPQPLRSYAVFLFCNAAIDLSSAIVSGMGCVRILYDHAGSVVIVFLGPCVLISERLCRLCHALHTFVVQQSLVILLLSFAYRLYVLGDVLNHRNHKTPRQIAWICLISFLPFILPTAFLYLHLTTETQNKFVHKLHLDAYVTTRFSIYGTTRTVLLNVFVCVFPIVVMIFIFVVRRKLIIRIKQANPSEKRHHESIARALTYQMLLPCGMAIGATLWLLNLMEIWNSEIPERMMMLAYSLFSLASPIINLTVLPPYRNALPSIFRVKTTVMPIA